MDSMSRLLSMPFIINNDECTGCMACKECCPFHAISSIEDNEGFLIPKVDFDKCKKCGLCKNTCPTITKIETKYNVLESKGLILRLRDRKALHRSASGGAFYGIAKFAIENLHAVVIGAAWTPDFGVTHICVEDLEGLKKLQNSKYVQSSAFNTFSQIKKYLKQDRWVLFSGTPCQIAGLKAYLNNDYDRLITIDLVCHGVPSPSFLRREFDEYTFKNEIINIRFRTKGWFTRSFFILRLFLKNRTVKDFSRNDSLYYSIFLKSASFRESCYKCKYASPNRLGDFTIGDCDSYTLYPEFFPDSSNSICLINSKKAKQLWDKGINLCFDYYPLDIEKEVQVNRQLSHPSVRPKERDYIYKDLGLLGYSYLKDKYNIESKSNSYFKTKIKLMIPSYLMRKLESLKLK